jgi:hypothetical protein
MLVPLFGFVISLAIALLLASAVVRLDRNLRPVRGASIAFVVSAFVGAAVYGRIYGALFADESYMLRTVSAVIGLFAGLLVSAALAGWLGARGFAVVRTRYQRVP